MSDASGLDGNPIEIEVQQVADMQRLHESFVLIDCREEDEYALARIEGAVLLPMSRWSEVADRLNEFTGRELVVYCHHGIRSLRVARWLRENGFPTAKSMRGGIDAWSSSIDPSVPFY